MASAACSPPPARSSCRMSRLEALTRCHPQEAASLLELRRWRFCFRSYQEMPPQNALRYPWTQGADCFVFLPVTGGAEALQKHPVLCFLHGVGEAVNGGNAEGVAAHQSPAWHAANGSHLTAPFLVVCPQRLEPGPWTAIDAKNLHLVLDQIIGEHSGCPERVFLTGFSYGGDAVFWFPTYDRGERFRKLWAVDPALSTSSSGSLPIPTQECPILVHYGEDACHEMPNFNQCAGLLKWPTEGIPVDGRFACDLGLPHVDTCRAAYQDQRAYEWLLQL
jgi:acetyl esterase/lipase